MRVLALLLLFASPFVGSLAADFSKCGIHEPQSTPALRVVGGTETKYGEFPWLAAINYKNKNTGVIEGIECGGVLISNRFILTSAHCLHHNGRVLVDVWLGARKLSEVDTVDVDKVRKYGIAAQIHHPQYNVFKNFFDIALIKLDKDVQFSTFIRPICLPGDDLPPPVAGTMLTVAGWGSTSVVGQPTILSDLKLQVTVPTFSHADCEERLGITVRSDQFCAEGEYQKGSCWGDGGGSLMEPVGAGIDRKWTALGVISGTEGCGTQGLPIVHTRVSSFAKWIKQTMASNS